MDKLKQIEEACVFGVSIDINTHRPGPAGRRTADQALKEMVSHYVTSAVIDLVPIDPEVRKEIAATDRLIRIRLYIHGFSKRSEIYHHSFDQAIDKAYDYLVSIGKIKEDM